MPLIFHLHHLGTSSDRAGLERLNRQGTSGGTREEIGTEPSE
jgi:hypothetical protein